MAQTQEVEQTKTTKGKAHLPCKLTQKEIYEAGKSLADALKRKSECEVRLESFKQQVKAEITTAEGEASKFQGLVASEIEYRMVEVEARFDFKAGRKTIIRMDTGEIIRTENITEDERQRMLPLPESSTVKK